MHCILRLCNQSPVQVYFSVFLLLLRNVQLSPPLNSHVSYQLVRNWKIEIRTVLLKPGSCLLRGTRTSAIHCIAATLMDILSGFGKG